VKQRNETGEKKELAVRGKEFCGRGEFVNTFQIVEPRKSSKKKSSHVEGGSEGKERFAYTEKKFKRPKKQRVRRGKPADGEKKRQGIGGGGPGDVSNGQGQTRSKGKEKECGTGFGLDTAGKSGLVNRNLEKTTTKGRNPAKNELKTGLKSERGVKEKGTCRDGEGCYRPVPRRRTDDSERKKPTNKQGRR